MAKVVNLEDINKIEENVRVAVFGMLSSIEERVSSTGKKYLDFSLSKKEYIFYGKSWNTELSEVNVKVGDIVKAIVDVSDYEGKKQLTVAKDPETKFLYIRKALAKDSLDEGDFYSKAPQEAVDMYGHLISTINNFIDDEYRSICLRVLEKYKEPLLFYSGGLKVHHAYNAGLLYHIYSMAQQAISMRTAYPGVNIERLLTGVITHDIGKLREIEVDSNGFATKYSTRGALLGHIIDGVLMLDEIFRELGISEENQILIHHMISSHHYEPAWGSANVPRFLEAELLHVLDMGDSRVDQIIRAVSTIEEGSFSSKVYFLGNREMYLPPTKDDFMTIHKCDKEKESA